MNRLQLLTEEVTSPPAPPTEIESGVIQRSRRAGQAFSLFAPMHYEDGYAYPLLVWLHGPNDDERQLQRIMPLVSMRNYVATAPRGTQALPPRGFHWGEIDVSQAEAEHRVFDSIDAACEKFHVAKHRIFLAGLDTAGTLAFQIGLRHPDRFAGVLSIGGPFPLDRQPLTRLAEARSLPLFIAQGRESERYPVERTCEELRLFHVAGLIVTLRQYPCGDELNTQMLCDMDHWMMEIVTGISSDCGDSPTPGQLN